jgi:hypothetical protein
MALRTLLEKAKPELIAALNAQMDEYPNIAEAVVRHLDGLYLVNQMTIEYWVDCKSLWFQVTGDLINHPWDFFEED